MESVLNEVEDAKNVLRDETRFFQFDKYSKAYTNLKIAMQLISYAHHPSRVDLDSFFMQGNPEENLSGILSATQDSVRNPFLHMFDDYLAPKIPWKDYGIVGLSIIHIGQVIPGLTLARQLRQLYPHLHIVVGGSVFNRHANLLDNKQQSGSQMALDALVGSIAGFGAFEGAGLTSDYDKAQQALQVLRDTGIQGTVQQNVTYNIQDLSLIHI